MEIVNKFKPLWEDQESRYYIITGGRGSAKSFSTTSFLGYLTLEQGHRILFTRWTMQSAHLSIIPEFIDKLERINAAPLFSVNKSDVKNIANGSEVLFRGIKTSSGNQTAALKSLQGITTWVLDEAEELTDEDTFDKIDLSVRQKGRQNRIILILNPATKEHWIYKRFFEAKGVKEGFNGVKDNVRYIHTTYEDCKKYLDQSFLDSIAIMKERRPERYKHQVLGGWLDKAEGVIFHNWSIGDLNKEEKDHVQSLTPVYGQDFGFSIDPTTLIETRIDTKTKRIYLKECFCKKSLTTSQIYELNEQYAKGRLIIGDSAEPRLIHEVKQKGCNIKAVKKGKDSIKAGIMILQDYDLIIDSESYNLIAELNNYVWHDKKTSTPVDAYNHCIDAARYAVYYQLSKNSGKYFVR